MPRKQTHATKHPLDVVEESGWILAFVGLIIFVVSLWAYFAYTATTYVDYTYVGLVIGALLFLVGMWGIRPPQLR